MSNVTTEWHGDALIAALKAEAPEALNHAAELLRGDSVPLAPIDRGPLRASVQVTPATAGSLTAYVSYDTPYAARQHEEMDWRHDEGQAKYLEGPLTENEAKYQQAIASRLGKALGP
ncbi:hypothetical protein G7068_13785 [Leucobacter viscericola]|uniref:Uncharacterized protein n=1 Tax=Leucobacter viscericola TaxID=2714935 RepID=A0A6G7XHR8_9MICO|nr:hypothetical protein [Leucobacter viscericola]QIK64150.1 hypothetical protein G7068_13785 [Leucobacter viscericola]